MFSRDAGIRLCRMSAFACVAKLVATTAWFVGAVVLVDTICPCALTTVVVVDPSAFVLVLVLFPEAPAPCVDALLPNPEFCAAFAPDSEGKRPGKSEPAEMDPIPLISNVLVACTHRCTLRATTSGQNLAESPEAPGRLCRAFT